MYSHQLRNLILQNSLITVLLLIPQACALFLVYKDYIPESLKKKKEKKSTCKNPFNKQTNQPKPTNKQITHKQTNKLEMHITVLSMPLPPEITTLALVSSGRSLLLSSWLMNVDLSLLTLSDGAVDGM